MTQSVFGMPVWLHGGTALEMQLRSSLGFISLRFVEAQECWLSRRTPTQYERKVRFVVHLGHYLKVSEAAFAPQGGRLDVQRFSLRKAFALLKQVHGPLRRLGSAGGLLRRSCRACRMGVVLHGRRCAECTGNSRRGCMNVRRSRAVCDVRGGGSS